MSEDKLLIIAEAGVNHNGNIDLALQLVDMAADAGADIVKFQTFSADRLATGSAPKAAYQKLHTDADQTQQEMLASLELSDADHRAIVAHCEARNIEFLSTGFDVESVVYLLNLGIKRLKIPSGEITNLPYLEFIAQTNQPVIISTGMAEMDEITAAINVLTHAGKAIDDITILHCTTDYPAKPEDLNLRAVKTIRDVFGCDVGYSDHSIGPMAAIAAGAMGARVIEKHITLDTSLPGPDHAASMPPSQFADMVQALRHLSCALGTGVKQPTPIEVENRSIVRKVIVASSPIAAGEILTADHLAVKRAGSGISPMRWYEVIGTIAPRSFAPNEVIEFDG